jgi:D-alanyl-D-alanine carboxypeptidase
MRADSWAIREASMSQARPLLLACIGILAAMAASAAHAEPTLPEKVQATLQTWLAERAPVEKVTGIAAYVSLGDPGRCCHVNPHRAH